MPLYITFVSDEWYEYPAVLEDDEGAWLAAYPPRVQFGPFDRIAEDDGDVWGYRDGARWPLAVMDYESRYVVFPESHHAGFESQRKYPEFEIEEGEE